VDSSFITYFVFVYMIQVMKSFLPFILPIDELPIMIMVEIKTAVGDLEDNCAEARGFLQARGYVVSKCEQDILAMLRPEYI
jgi:hypothetical protein